MHAPCHVELSETSYVALSDSEGSPALLWMTKDDKTARDGGIRHGETKKKNIYKKPPAESHGGRYFHLSVGFVWDDPSLDLPLSSTGSTFQARTAANTHKTKSFGI